jgi:DHA1 family inner membrane transport protein
MLGPLLVDLSREFDVPLGRAGLLAAAMALPWALGAPFTGVLSDRLGRRPLIVLALAGIGATSIACAGARSFAALLGLRFLCGVFGAFGPAAMMAAVGDLFPPARRARAMGWLNMGFALSAVAGVPLIGVVDGWLGWRAAFVTAGVALLALALLIRVAFPAPPPVGAAGGVLSTYRVVFRLPRLANVLGANLLERSTFFMATVYLPPFLMLTYARDAAQAAPALSAVALGTITGNVLGGWLGDRFPRPAIFVVAQTLAGGIALALFGLAPGLTASAATGALFGLTNAASRPAFLAYSSELLPTQRGAVLGLVGITNQGGIVLGSALGALVMSLGGYAALAVAAAAGGALAAALAVPLALRGEVAAA